MTEQEIINQYYKSFENGTEQKEIKYLSQFEKDNGGGQLLKFKNKYLFVSGLKGKNFTDYCNFEIFNTEYDALKQIAYYGYIEIY